MGTTVDEGKTGWAVGFTIPSPYFPSNRIRDIKIWR